MNIIAWSFEWNSPLEQDIGKDMTISSSRTGKLQSNNTGFNIIPKDEIYIQFKLMSSFGLNNNFNTESEVTLLQLKYLDATLLKMIATKYNTIQLWKGSKETLLYEEDNFSNGFWNIHEIRYKGGSNGNITYRLKGEIVYEYNGDVRTIANPSITEVATIVFRGLTYYTNFWFDDIVVNDTTGSYNNSWPDGVRVKLLKPNGDHSITWSRTGGSNNYGAVNDVTNNYSLYTNTVGAIDLYNMSDCNSDTYDIKWARAIHVIKGYDTDIKHFTPIFKISGTNYYGNTVKIPYSYHYVRQLFEVSPATGNKWTKTELDGIIFGQRADE